MTIFVSECDIGPENGLRVAVKDSIDIAGTPTRLGSYARNDIAPATQNADVVEHILAAQHHIIGKTVMHELAFGVTGINHYSGTPINPLYPKIIAGGSSSGSAAAVAAGRADYSIGTDTGGSVRFPAACCGVFGFKPTFGRVSRKGVWPAESSLDCVGTFAADLSTLLIAEQTIDPSFNLAHSQPDTRFGLITNTCAEPNVATNLQEHIKSLSIDVALMGLPLLDEAFEAGLVVINAEMASASASAELLASEKLGDDITVRLNKAGKTTQQELAIAEKQRIAFTAEVDRLLESADILVMPAIPKCPLSLQDALAGKTDLKMTALVRPFNLSGHPALVIPFEVNGNPIGIQLIGRKNADEQVFAAAHTILMASNAV